MQKDVMTSLHDPHKAHPDHPEEESGVVQNRERTRRTHTLARDALAALGKGAVVAAALIITDDKEQNGRAIASAHGN
jgi:hypothetical protein